MLLGGNNLTQSFGVKGSVTEVAAMEEHFGGRDALDNLCNSPGSVAIGNRQFLHAGWIYPPIACNCAGRTYPAVDFWPQASCMTIDQAPVRVEF
jgi:hypothetical protein